MGNGGESEREGREGEGRRIQLEKNDITCAAREGKRRGKGRERDGMGGGRDEDSRGKLH